MTSPMKTTGRRTGASAAALTAIGLLLGCGGGATDPYGGGKTPPPPPANKVNATPSLAFAPASLTVTAGTPVTFAFGSVAHNVFFDPAPGAPADIDGANAGVSVDRAFPTAGTYRYTCHIHPFMHGTVIVRAAGTGTAAGGY
jgi:plastocyanin